MLSKILQKLKRSSSKKQAEIKTVTIDGAMNKFFGSVIGGYELFEFTECSIPAICRVYKQSGEYIIEILLVASNPFDHETAEEVIDHIAHTIASHLAIKEQKAILWKTHVKTVKGFFSKGVKQL
ncbi:hypothetical protein SAMN06265182_1229 [Persephonella hydrogeniphila]|uniref:Uncharacterized protein n=1 Tax=Persephonella hydrogeniphila TaxID=198703 RepID=A0A285NFJ2_9AQUI|nr:hypothetical protein [Persephonella hydrogeniphila]SNZ08240.1 hypothetical protein SAMN06265182_1229 [Persephonella hydrogeniphila]